MTPLGLQRAVIEEIRLLTKDMILKDVKGNQAHLQVFEQNLPLQEKQEKEETELDEDMDLSDFDEEDEDMQIQTPYPYCIVRLTDGKSKDNQSIAIRLILGIYDDDTKVIGHRYIMNIFEDIRRRFRVKPILAKKYMAEEEMEWALPDEDDTYPFFFGAMDMKFRVKDYQKEDEFA